MKQSSIYIIIFFALIHITACEDFLDRKSQNVFEETTYYSTPDELITGVTYCYNALWRHNFHLCKFIIGNMAADDATKGGENDAEWPQINAAIEFRVTPRENIAELIWEPCYRGITRANYMLDILRKRDFPDESPAGYKLTDRLTGECEFIRAFFSYYLVTLFGDAPYYTRPTISNITDDLYELKDRSVIWAQLEADLLSASQKLPNQSQYPKDEWGRITKGAAQALLGKVYLFQKKYDEAAKILRKVVQSPEYKLLDNYGRIFDKGVEFSTESVFEIPFGGTQFSYVSQDDGGLGNGILQFQARRGDDGWGYNNPTDDLVNEYEAGDPRLIYTIIFPQDEFEPGVPQSHPVPKYQHHSRKAYLTKNERVPDYGNIDYHYRIIRLSDVYLMYAEASLLGNAEKNIDDAVFYLNEVRKRANSTPKVDAKRYKQQITIAAIDLPMRTYTTDYELLAYIKHERRVELGMEDHRWWDLLRWGETGKMAEYYNRWGSIPCPNGTMDEKGKNYNTWIARFPNNTYPVFPIPQTKIEETDGKLKQNEYYKY
ncbi:MAG: RagB/SusD family nutrient uptake outer membrane protein [Dysgonamonadaceae bacterium]|jgi:hypothetical protein|nr:RagB/SusD family nutrient uptake outer membrane protein [Dysgonamonadaceae bacterium]